MSEAPQPIDDADAALAELMAKDLDAVRHVHAQLMAATTPDDVNSLGRTYQRVSRCLRQTLMLKMRDKREREQARARARAARLDPEPPQGEAPAPRIEDPVVIERVCDLQDAVGRVAAAALGEDERCEALLDDMDAYLDYEAERPDFLTHDLDAHVATHCARLGLPAELAVRWRDLPPAPWTVGLTPDDDAAPAAPPNPALPWSGSG